MSIRSARISILGLSILLCADAFLPVFAGETPTRAEPLAGCRELFGKENLIAWCIVPFDTQKRSPQERAAMLQKLGFKHFAYDWRDEHIPQFDLEMEAIKKAGINLDAFWFPGTLDNTAKAILELLKRHQIKTQLWVMKGGGPASGDLLEKNIAAAVTDIKAIAAEADKIGCTVALYNHGGWFGEPENQLEIIKRIGMANVGIAYNLHHGHEHLSRLPELLQKMKPHLLAVNINGMETDGDKKGKQILPLGEGARDLDVLKTIVDSGYKGRIGILGHINEDVEKTLRKNLDGLERLVRDLTSPVKVTVPYPLPVNERFEVTTLIDDLKQPMSFSLLPDGRILYIEYKGAVKMLHPKSRTPVECAKIKVTNSNENGMLGQTLDPDFAKNGYVYLYYSPPDYNGQRLSRFVLNGDVLDMASEKHILEFEEQRKDCCHHAGTLAFAPDGCLLISTGDNTHPGGDSDGYAPIDERPGRESFDAQKSASNCADLRGKILRIKLTPEGGYTIPDGNLFPKDGAGGRPEIFVMGCRNPWRMSVDPKNGFVYWGEVGPDSGGYGPRGARGYDEINQARKAGNFGWPYFVGPNEPYNRYDFATKKAGEKFDPAHPVNESKNNTGSKVLPPAVPAWIYYPYSKSDVFPELNEGSGRTACAGPVFHIDPVHNASIKMPDYFDNCLFFFEWSRNWIKVARMDADSNLLRIEHFMHGYPFKRPISMQIAADGALYVMEYGDTWGENKNARLSRIEYVRGNRRPVAKAQTTNNIGKTPLEVSFSGTDSFDPDGDTLTYEWRIGADGAPISKEAVCKYTFDKPGIYNVQLTVTDPQGALSSATVPVLAGNAPPKVKFLRPKDGDFYTPGNPVVYRLFIDDEEDGDSDQHEEAMNPRVVVEAVRSKSRDGAAGNADDDPDGLKLMKKSDCFNCHAVDRKILGPAYRDVALKYKGQATAFEESVQRVMKGSSKVWSDVPMLAHPQHTVEEVRSMVSWVYALKDGNKGRVISKGVKGTVAVEVPKDTKEEKNQGAFLVLDAAYTDAGTPVIGPLTGTAKVVLRPRQIEAEFCDKSKGAVKPLTGGGASGGQFMGAIDHNDYLVFNGLNLSGLKKLTCRFASDGQGCKMRILAGGLDGTLLAEFEIAKTGGWEKWTELSADVTNAPEGRKDVYIQFVNPGKSGLMNLDWVKFE